MKTYQQLQDEFYTNVRRELVHGLMLLTPDQRLKFFRLCGRYKGKATTAIEAVGRLPIDKLPWAMDLVCRNVPVDVE